MLRLSLQHVQSLHILYVTEAADSTGMLESNFEVLRPV